MAGRFAGFDASDFAGFCGLDAGFLANLNDGIPSNRAA
jgi:hypothetical protein